MTPSAVPSSPWTATATSTLRTWRKSCHVSWIEQDELRDIQSAEPDNATCIVRTRWVDYNDKEFDPSQIEPGWYVLIIPPTLPFKLPAY